MHDQAITLSTLALALAACGSQAGLGGDDRDGIVGGSNTFILTVNDSVFAPTILKTQNLANVTLTLTNAGTSPHGMRIECMTATCFPQTAHIDPLAPGASATTTFQTPRTEGIYDITSNGPVNVQSGQFIVQ